MNSVMDDNRLLTLPSNERIRVLPHMKLIFEIRDLKFATPATATRAGILYISEGQQWNNMVQSWIQKVVRWVNTAQRCLRPGVAGCSRKCHRILLLFVVPVAGQQVVLPCALRIAKKWWPQHAGGPASCSSLGA